MGVRVLLAVLTGLLVLPAAARAELVFEHDVSVNAKGAFTVAWVGHDGRYTTLKAAQGTLDGGVGPPRVVATAMRTGAGGADDFQLQAPQVEHFDDDAVLLTWSRIAFRSAPGEYSPAEQFASVDFGPAQRLGEDTRGATMTVGADPSGWAVLAWGHEQDVVVARRAPRDQVRLDGVARGVGAFSQASDISPAGDATIVSFKAPCQFVATQVGAGGFGEPRVLDGDEQPVCYPGAFVGVAGDGDVAAMWNFGGRVRGSIGFGAPQTLYEQRYGVPRGGISSDGEVLALLPRQPYEQPLLVRRAPGADAFATEVSSLPADAVLDVAGGGAALAVSTNAGQAFRRRPGEAFGPGEMLTGRQLIAPSADADGAVSFIDETKEERRLTIARWPGGERAPDVVLATHPMPPPVAQPPASVAQAIVVVPTAPVRLMHGRVRVGMFCYAGGPDCRVRLTLRVQVPRSQRGRLVARWSGTLRAGEHRKLRLRPRRGTRSARMVLAELDTAGGSFVDRRSITLRR